MKSETATYIPREIGDDLFQPVFITNDDTVVIDGTPVDFFPALFHRSQESPSSDLSAIHVGRQLGLLRFGGAHLVNGAVQIGLKLQPARISIKS